MYVCMCVHISLVCSIRHFPPLLQSWLLVRIHIPLERKLEVAFAITYGAPWKEKAGERSAYIEFPSSVCRSGS